MFQGSGALGINNIKVECCEIQVSCTPQLKEEVVFQYDNRLGNTSYTETYSEENGFRSETTYSSAGSQVSERRHTFGVTVGAMLKFLGIRVQGGVEQSEQIASAWAQTRTSDSSKVELIKRKINVPAGFMVQIWQPVLRCGSFVIHNKFVRRVDIPLNQIVNVTGLSLQELEAQNLNLTEELRLVKEELSNCVKTSVGVVGQRTESKTYKDEDINVHDWLQSLFTVLG
jgi:hypothetical protein